MSQPSSGSRARPAVTVTELWHSTSAQFRETCAGVLLALIVALFYVPVWQAGFIWDDDIVFHFNDHVTWIEALKGMWLHGSTPDYFPITYSVCLLESRLFGGALWGYHAVNLMFHLAGVIVLWRVLRRLGLPRAWWIALLFGVHPLTVTSVAWATEIKNTMSFVFYAASVLYYLRYVGSKQSAAYALSLGSFLCALLSKTSGVCLPLFFLVCRVWPGSAVAGARRLRFGDVLPVLPYLVLSGVMAVLTVSFQIHHALMDHPLNGDGPLVRLANAGAVFWFYFGKALWPFNLMIVYPQFSPEPGIILRWLPDVALLAWIGMAWRTRHAAWARSLLFAMAYILLALLPVMGFVDMAFMIFSHVADHFVYLALPAYLALFVASADWALRNLARSTSARVSAGLLSPATRRSVTSAVAAVAAVLLLGTLTWKRTILFSDPRAIWQDNMLKNPQSWAVYKNIAQTYMDRGQYTEAAVYFEHRLHLRHEDGVGWYDVGAALLSLGQYKAAATYFKQAIQLEKFYPQAHNNYAVALERLHRDDEAMREYQRALDEDGALVEPCNNLANLLLAHNRLPEAEASYVKALNRDPWNATTWCNLGALRVRQGRVAGALPFYRRALELQPDFREAYLNLGYAEGQLGHTEAAIAAYEAATRLKPGDPEPYNIIGGLWANAAHLDQALQWFQKSVDVNPNYAPAYNNMALVFATSPQAAYRDPIRAIGYARKACEIAPTRADMLHTLAAAYASAGRFQEAAATERSALAHVDDRIDAKLQKRMHECLTAYASGKAGVP